MIKLIKNEIRYYRWELFAAISVAIGSLFFGQILSFKSVWTNLGLIQGMIAINAFLIFPHYSQKRDRTFRMLPLSAKKVGLARGLTMLSFWAMILTAFAFGHVLFMSQIPVHLLSLRVLALFAWLAYGGSIFSLIAEISYTKLSGWLKGPLLSVLMISLIFGLFQISFFLDKDLLTDPYKFLNATNTGIFKILFESPVGLALTLIVATILLAITYLLYSKRGEFTGAQAGVFAMNR